jgi:hypothetical protein
LVYKKILFWSASKTSHHQLDRSVHDDSPPAAEVTDVVSISDSVETPNDSLYQPLPPKYSIQMHPRYKKWVSREALPSVLHAFWAIDFFIASISSECTIVPKEGTFVSTSSLLNSRFFLTKGSLNDKCL